MIILRREKSYALSVENGFVPKPGTFHSHAVPPLSHGRRVFARYPHPVPRGMHQSDYLGPTCFQGVHGVPALDLCRDVVLSSTCCSWICGDFVWADLHQSYGRRGVRFLDRGLGESGAANFH